MLENGGIGRDAEMSGSEWPDAIWSLPGETAGALERGAMNVLLETNDLHFVFRIAAMLPEGAQLRILTPPRVVEQPARLPTACYGEPPSMTRRQRDVAALLLRSLSNKEIARELGLSHFTVRNHVSQILRLLGASTRRSAICQLEHILHQTER